MSVPPTLDAVKAKRFALATQAMDSGRFAEARDILAQVDAAFEPNARALKEHLLRMLDGQPHPPARALPVTTADNPGGTLAPARRLLPSGRPLPRISIVTPSYNQGAYIAETIQSVIDQGYPDVEHILIDGGSTDDTMRVVEQFRGALRHCVSEPDRGQSHALNKGFARATGDILCWLNSDDQLAPGALYAVALAFDQGEPDMVAGICEIYSEGRLRGRHLTSCEDGPLPLDDLLDLDNCWNSGQFFYQPEVFFTRGLWERAGAMVREDCHFSMDYELWCRFALAGARLKVIGTPLAHFRSHPAQKTSSEAGFKAELRKVRQQFVDEHRLPDAVRPPLPIDWARRPRLALLNDHGAQYGAGIAHARIGAALEIAECEVELLALSSFVRNGSCDTEALLAALDEIAPDAVIWGNVHSIGPSALQVVRAVCERFQSAWIAHDFWIVTGRCAYFADCRQYLSDCDASCPTADAYPRLDRQVIALQHRSKRDLLASGHGPALWANSSWTQATLEHSLGSGPHGQRADARIRLGIPSHAFGRKTRNEARRDLDIPPGDFVLLFSASSLSDERKGVGILLQALQALHHPALRLLILGNADIDIGTLGHEVTALGYVTDGALLATAFAAADVFVGPSQEETFGQVFVEAAFSGTPCVAFDRSGMVDAVVHRTTGLRTRSSPEALARAIHQLADDSELREQLGFWAPIWARSMHSLEASYRSMHLAFRRMGLLQRLSLPRRITLAGKSRLMPELDTEIRCWIPGRGVSPPEGPYPPDFPTVLHWCFGPSSSFRLRVASAGRVRVEIDCMNPLFDAQVLSIEVDGVDCGSHTLGHAPPPTQSLVKFEADLAQGWRTMTVVAAHIRTPDPGEPRALSFIVNEIRVSPLSSDPA